MRLSRIVVPVKFLLVAIISISVTGCNGYSSTGLSRNSRSLVAFTVLFSAAGIPQILSLPNRKSSLVSSKVKSSGYYRWANNLLSWVFDKLEASDEDDDDKSGPGRIDIDSLEDSSEEIEAAKRRKAAEVKKLKKTQSRNKGRLGSATPTGKPTGGGSDPAVEEASIPELKEMLTKLKKQDEGIFGTHLLTNPIATPIWSFGTRMFRKMYCGLRPQNSYCIQDDAFGSSNFFDGFKRALSAFRSLQ